MKPTLFHRDRLGQVARLVYVAAAADGDVVRQQLAGNDFQNRRQQFRRIGNVKHVVGGFADLLVTFGGDRDDRPDRAFTSFRFDSVFS